jgi:hypothetical protein
VIVPAASIEGPAALLKPRRCERADRTFEYVTTRDLLSSFVLPISKVVLGRRASPDFISASRRAVANKDLPLEYFQGGFGCA